MHSKLPFLKILSPTGGPVEGDPKIILGASRWPSELPMTSVGGDFLRTFFLHEIKLPKLTQTAVFLGLLDVAKKLYIMYQLTFPDFPWTLDLASFGTPFWI